MIAGGITLADTGLNAMQEIEDERKKDDANKINEKEKITILLAEYTSLQTEINARVTTSYQLVGFSLLALIFLLQAILSIVLEAWKHPAISILLIVSLVGVLVIGIAPIVAGARHWFKRVRFEIYNPGLRVQQLENEINRRAGERLLLWENDHGGLTPDYRRNEQRWSLKKHLKELKSQDST